MEAATPPPATSALRPTMEAVLLSPTDGEMYTRLRAFTLAAGAGLLVSSPIDLIYGWHAHRSAPELLVVMHGLLGAAMLGLYAWTGRVPPRRRYQTTMLVMPVVVSVWLGVHSVLTDGLTSGLGLAAAIPICLGGSLPLPFRFALPGAVVAALAYPATVTLSALWSRRIDAQFADPDALVHFGTSSALLLFGAVVAAYTSELTWRLRRRLYETRSLGRYKLLRLLGRGGMGEVWAAQDTILKREVALKILRARDGDDEAALRRFEQEVKAMAELRHPNTVRIFDYDVSDGLRYFAMELLEGSTLAQMIAADGPLSPRRAVTFIHQAAHGLAEAHRKGIIHRDVKPENIFVANAGSIDLVKLLDFGIARRETAEELNITAAGHIIGTLAYMSPEAISGRRLDARADVYSLGATLYFLLTGTPPFAENSPAGIMTGHLFGEVEPPSKRRGQILPPALEGLILRCLEKRPEDRFKDAEELVSALELCSDHIDDLPPSNPPSLTLPPDAPTMTGEIPPSIPSPLLPR